MLGSGAIIVIDDSISILDVAMKTAKFYRHESCGKCTPCREGTNWTVKMLEDRKSTRLNSSHANISYAVFCLKKKNILEYTSLSNFSTHTDTYHLPLHI